MDLLIISTRFIHTDHLEFPRMYRAWRVNSFQGHETRSKTMHHVKSVTELRIAPTLAAFNWVTRYNLSCSCFNPVFNFPLLSLTLSSFPQILCVTVSFSPFSRFFVGFLAITSREIATRAVSPKTRLQLAEFHPLDDWNERGRGTCFFFFFRRKLLIFGRCIRAILVDVPRCCSYFSIGKIHELMVMLLCARGYYSDAVAISGEKFSMAER